MLKRVFYIDMEHCPNCGGGKLRIIAAILVRPVITRISPICSGWIHWPPVSTNTLIDGWSDFSDIQWTNYPARFYRLRSP